MNIRKLFYNGAAEIAACIDTAMAMRKLLSPFSSWRDEADAVVPVYYKMIELGWAFKAERPAVDWFSPPEAPRIFQIKKDGVTDGFASPTDHIGTFSRDLVRAFRCQYRPGLLENS